jgi:DNA-binding winged helix-turn-helix (wHTH) protein/Tfp pilus assembly protein PilF
MSSSLAPPRPLPGRYAFGPFRLDTDRLRILRNERALSWRSGRHFELLRALIDHEPAVVDYEELRRRVWDGKEIQPQTIAQTVKDLRSRLGIYADCIRNQPGKGYYFDRPPSGFLTEGNLPLGTLTLLKVASDEWNRRTGASVLRALALFRRVVELESGCVEGHVGVAACVTIGCHVGFAVLPPAALCEAREAADRALSLAKDKRQKASALCQIAQIKMMYDWEFDEAGRLLSEALALDESQAPTHHLLAHLYLVTNRWNAVMEAITAARRILPSSPMLHSTAGLMLHFMRRHAEAVKICAEAVSLHPTFARGHVMLGFAYEADGQVNRAIETFETACEMEEHATVLAALGHAHATAGHVGKARATLRQLRRLGRTQFVSPYFSALVHVGLGDKNAALSDLERAYEERCDWLIHAGVEPRWDTLRDCERFRGLMKTLGLADLGRAS